jgi:hypothetical protein
LLAQRSAIIFGAIIAASIAVGLAAASLSALSLGALSPLNQNDAKINFYLTDAPRPGDPKYLEVNISSIIVRYQNPLPCSKADGATEYQYQVPSNVGVNVNLTSLAGQSKLLGAASIPPGTVNEIIFMISGAKAFFPDGSSVQLKVVANGKLMMPVQFDVTPGGSIVATIDVTPNSIHLSNGNEPILSPVVHITIVEDHRTISSTITATSSTTTTILGSRISTDGTISCTSTSETTTITNSPTD